MKKNIIPLKSIIINFFVALLILLPAVSFAQTPSSSPVCDALFGGSINTLKDIIDYATCLIVKSIIPLLFIVALAFFVWGIVQYFLNPNNSKEREKGRQYIVWALIGMFVLFSIAGLVEILRNTFGVEGSPIPLLPETQ
jgi:hypothetical protein